MNISFELRAAKRHIRAWIAKFSDQKLAEVTAFNADGKMSYIDPCGCLMGVTFAGHLHNALLQFKTAFYCDGKHYDAATRLDDRGRAETAYRRLGSLGYCFSKDWYEDIQAMGVLRQRRMSAILRAEMRRRARAKPPVETLSFDTVTG